MRPLKEKRNHLHDQGREDTGIVGLPITSAPSQFGLHERARSIDMLVVKLLGTSAKPPED
jgi:hypothetical protein